MKRRLEEDRTEGEVRVKKGWAEGGDKYEEGEKETRRWNEGKYQSLRTHRRVIGYGMLLRQWWRVAGIAKKEKGMRRNKKIEKYIRERIKEERIKEADTRGEMATLYKHARELGGKGRGPKKRMGGRLPEDEPTVEDWREYVKLPGQKGGYKAIALTEEEHLAIYKGGHGEDGIDDEGLVAELARRDQKGVEKAIRSTKFGKATRETDIPAEIWRMCLTDNWGEEGKRREH